MTQMDRFAPDRFTNMTDDELVSACQQGDGAAADFLVEKYKYLVLKRVRMFYLTGADHDDLIQEGMIGIYKAIRTFDPERKASFETFATRCINGQIYTAITAANRHKYDPLNSASSLDAPDQDTNRPAYYESTDHLPVNNPETLIIEREQTDALLGRIMDCLSPMERLVCAAYIEGMSYAEIGVKLNKSPKSIDNAVQRIRAKVWKLLN